jgi:hypothetical protein
MTIAGDQTATGQAPATTTTVTLTWGTNPTAGAKAIVVVMGSATVTSVVDNGTTPKTFTADVSVTASGANRYVYRADGITLPASGSYHVTITAASGLYVAQGRTYTGVATGGPATSNSATGTSTSVSSGSVTPSVTGSLVIGGMIDDSSLDPETITLTTSGATNLYTNTNGNNFCGGVADHIVSGTSAQTLAWTLGDSADWAGIAAVYSPASGTPHTDTASLAVTPSTTATRQHGAKDSAALTVAPSESATPSHGHAASASLAVTPALSASASGGVPGLTDSPVTSSTGAATSGVFTTANAFSPGAGTMVLVRVENMFTASPGSAATFTCQDSHGTSYASALQAQNSFDVAGAAIFWHVYSSAPGSTTLTITSSVTGTALELLVSPTLITGQASSPIGPNTLSTDPSGSTTSLTGSLTTTVAGSRVYLAGGVGSGSAMTAASNTATTATYNGYNNAATGISTSATATPGATTFGWTCSPASTFGGNLIGVEVLPATTTPHTATASLTVTPSTSAARSHGAKDSASLTVTPAMAAASAGNWPSNAILDTTGSPILDTAGGFIEDTSGGDTASASLTVTPTATATAERGHSASASLTVTPVTAASGDHPRTATASLTVTPATTAAGGHPRTASASLTVTPAGTATPAHGHAAAASLAVMPATLAEAGNSASLTVAPVLSATAAHGHAASAALAVTPVTTATRQHAATAQAALTVTPAGSANGESGQGRTATASLTVTPATTAHAAHGHAASAALTVTPAGSATSTAAVHHTATASLTVTPSTTAKSPAPFPGSPLDLECSLNLAGTWTDVTTYAYQRAGDSPPITITRGRPDESSQANPSTCAWEWNNRDGRFSPRNPLSPYYGLLGRNTPVRWSVPAAASYLRLEGAVGAYASCPENARLDVTGSIEVRVGLRLTDWNACDLVSKYDGTTGSSWIINTQDDGTLVFWWRDSSGTLRGAVSTVPVPFTAGDFALRFTLNASNGTVTFYVSDGIDGTWTQLGSAVSPTGGASTSVYSGSGTSVPLTAGWSANNPAWQMLGRVNGFRVYNGIGGTVVADAAFGSQPNGTTSWTDTAGNAWSVSGGAEVSGRDYRFHGEMSSQPPKWDVTGNDMSVMAQAGGPLRRLSQGTNNAMSAMKRAILLQTGTSAPVAYWPMEDNAGATVFGSATGGPPITFDASPAPSLAADSSFIASAPLPTLGGSRLQAPVPGYTGTGAWAVSFLLKLSPPAADAVLLRVVTPGAACGVIYIKSDTSGDLGMTGYAEDGSTAFDTAYYNFSASGNPLMVFLIAQQAGGSTQYSLFAVAPGADSGGVVTETASGGAGTVVLIQPDVTGAFTDTAFGHLQVQSLAANGFELGAPLNAWNGELAAVRYARLAAENGYACRILGPPSGSAQMGPQGQATLSALLQECEAADLGQQFEPRQVLALGYRTLASMCDQSPALTLDYTAAELGGVAAGGGDSGLDPTYDDQLSKNDWTVTRGAASGSQGATVQVTLDDGSAMSVGDPPDGIGDYANTQTVNVEYDDQLQDVGGWMVRQGTIDDLRWPVIPLNLARGEMAALRQDAADLELGDMLQIDDAPDLVIYDPVKQVVLGSKESLGGFHYTMEFNAVPEVAYETVILDDPDYGRVDTDGSQLASAVSSNATTLSVSTTGPSGIIWTPLAADWPFDINVGGERMTVTAVSGTSSPQSFTVTRSVNGVVKAQAAGADVRLWFAPVLALA